MFRTTLAVPPEGERDRLLLVASAAAVLRAYRPFWTAGRWTFETAAEPADCPVDLPHVHLHATNPAVASVDSEEQGTLWRGMTEVSRGALAFSKGRLRRWAANWLLKQDGADLEGPLGRSLGIQVVYTLADFYLCPVCEQWLPLARPEHVEAFVG